MRKIVLPNKTGFKNLNPDISILIRDKRGLIFYDNSFVKKPVLFFNLPPGEYFVEKGSFTPMDTPVKYKLVKLPPPQRRRPKPFNYKVEFQPNPNKCSIIWGENLIIFDNAFKEKPLPVCDFVLFHEYSHACYKIECLADLMAANYMLMFGYNPSQIGMSPVNSLSEKQYKRKLLMVKKMMYAKRS